MAFIEKGFPCLIKLNKKLKEAFKKHWMQKKCWGREEDTPLNSLNA